MTTSPSSSAIRIAIEDDSFVGDNLTDGAKALHDCMATAITVVAVRRCILGISMGDEQRPMKEIINEQWCEESAHTT